MFKKILVSAAVVGVCGVVFAAGETPASVKTRMDNLVSVFSTYKADAFKLVNGQDLGGSTSTGKGAVGGPSDRADILAVTRTTDDNGEIFCARATGANNEGSEWAAYPGNVALVGTDANTMTDVDGKPIIPRMIAALRSGDHREAVMTYAIKVKDPISGREVRQSRTALVYGSQKLDPGRTVRKFVCAASWPTR